MTAIAPAIISLVAWFQAAGLDVAKAYTPESWPFLKALRERAAGPREEGAMAGWRRLVPGSERPTMAVPVPSISEIVRPVLSPILLVVALYFAIKIVVPIVRTLRQRAYDSASEAEAVCLVVSSPAGFTPDPELSVELIRSP